MRSSHCRRSLINDCDLLSSSSCISTTVSCFPISNNEINFLDCCLGLKRFLLIFLFPLPIPPVMIKDISTLKPLWPRGFPPENKNPCPSSFLPKGTNTLLRLSYQRPKVKPAPNVLFMAPLTSDMFYLIPKPGRVFVYMTWITSNLELFCMKLGI